ncbi:FAD-dependent oxidoreductase [Caldivirga sp.]|uniref:FAD-dependent oxidoreductase n=1 Tax=Caldivirga sp. TaxID=2080243 RepID=UPI003D13A157
MASEGQGRLSKPVMLSSPRTGEVRGFICCEWWCSGYWLSNGSLNQCAGQVNAQSSLIGFMSSLAKPSVLPRSRLVKIAWPIVVRFAKGMRHIDASQLPEPPKAKLINVTTDVLVVGGGLSGLITAMELSRLGLKVTIVEGNGELGGRNVELEGQNGPKVSGYVNEVKSKLTDGVLTGVVFDGFLEDAAIGHSLDGTGLFRFNYKVLVLATGSREVPLVFPGNYKVPMYAGLTYLKLVKAGVVKGEPVLYGTDEWGLAVARELVKLGLNPLVIDHAIQPRTGKLSDLKDLRTLMGVYLSGVEVEGTRFRLRYQAPEGPKKFTTGEVTGDALVSTIRVPAIELLAQLGAELVYDVVLSGVVPRHKWDGEVIGLKNVYVVGEVTGIIPLSTIPLQAKATAYSIAAAYGLVKPEETDRAIAEFKNALVTSNPAILDAFNRLEKGLHEVGYFQEPNVPEVPQWASDWYFLDKADDQLICFCEDVSLGDLLRVTKEFLGLKEIKINVLHDEVPKHRELKMPKMEYIKRATGLGTGACQGKLCMITANLMLARLMRRKPYEFGLFKQRPPLNPIPLGTLGDAE